MPEDEQSQVYINGKEFLYSRKVHTVGLTPERCEFEEGERVTFTIGVANDTDHNILLSIDGITAFVTMVDSDTHGKSLKIYRRDEIEKELNGDIGDMLTALSEGYQRGAAGSSTSTTRGTFDGNYGAVGTLGDQFHGTYTATTTSYDPVRARMEIAALDEQARLREETKENTINAILDKDTVFPGTDCIRDIIVQMPQVKEQQGEFVIYVSIDGENHAFKFRQTKI